MDKGGVIPKSVLDQGHFTPRGKGEPKKGNTNFLTTGEAEDLVAALQMLGHVDDSEAELVAEKLVNLAGEAAG